MIYNVGLLPESNLKHVGKAYDLYRDRCDDTRPDKKQSTEFREKYHCKMPQIHFLGCFDTVGSLGVPKLPWYLGGSTCELNLFSYLKRKELILIKYSLQSLSGFAWISRHKTFPDCKECLSRIVHPWSASMVLSYDDAFFNFSTSKSNIGASVVPRYA